MAKAELSNRCPSASMRVASDSASFTSRGTSFCCRLNSWPAGSAPAASSRPRAPPARTACAARRGPVYIRERMIRDQDERSFFQSCVPKSAERRKSGGVQTLPSAPVNVAPPDMRRSVSRAKGVQRLPPPRVLDAKEAELMVVEPARRTGDRVSHLSPRIRADEIRATDERQRSAAVSFRTFMFRRVWFEVRLSFAPAAFRRRIPWRGRSRPHPSGRAGGKRG